MIHICMLVSTTENMILTNDPNPNVTGTYVILRMPMYHICAWCVRSCYTYACNCDGTLNSHGCRCAIYHHIVYNYACWKRTFAFEHNHAKLAHTGLSPTLYHTLLFNLDFSIWMQHVVHAYMICPIIQKFKDYKAKLREQKPWYAK